MDDDSELAHLRGIKAARLRLGLDNLAKKEEGHSVTVYTTTTCPYCHMAMEYMASKGVKYKEVNLSNDSAAAMKLVQTTGQTGVPQINIDGEWILGFDRPAIDRALGLKK